MGGSASPKDVKKSQTRTELAKDFLARNELDSARNESEKAIRLDPNNAEAHLVLGLVDFLHGTNNFRLLEIDDCLTGVDAEGLRQEMDEYFVKAKGSFAAARRLDSSYAEAYANEAKVAALLDDYEGAIKLLETALETPHRLANLGLTRADLGWARFNSGDHVGAAKELRQALQFTPNMCVAKYRLGRVYFEREEWNKALEQFQAVVAPDGCPKQVHEAHLYLAKTMTQLDLTDEAMLATSECATLAPKSCIAAECLAIQSNISANVSPKLDQSNGDKSRIAASETGL